MNKERFIKRFCVSTLILALTVTSLAGFSRQAYAEKPRYGGVFKFIRGYSPRAPGWPSSSSGLEITELYACLEPLTKIDDNGEPVPYLATSWEYGPDLKSLTLKIRKGVKFHDGSDLNAETVKMNLDERKGGINGWELDSIKSIEVIDEHAVRLNLSVFKNVLLESLANYNGLMVSPKVVEKARTKKGKKWAQKNPVGTGPFKFAKFERSVILKYERFDGYWQKGQPYLDGVETHYINDTMTALAALRAGEVHALWEAPSDKAAQLKKEGFAVFHYPAGIRAFATDSANPESVFADKKVRAALEYAINRKAITDGLGHGYWEPVNQYSSMKCNGYNPALIGRPYDPEKAKQLLKEAGYPNGIKTRLIAGTTSYGKDLMAALQRDLKKGGIDTEIVFYDAGKYFYTMIKGWKDGITIFEQNSPINLTQELNSLYIKGAARFPNMHRPIELQEVLQRAETVPDFKDQRTLVKQAIRMMSDEAVVTPLWSIAEIYILKKSVHDPGFGIGRRGQWSPGGAWLSE